jgi:multidrug efflux pump subunit AcrB
MKERIKKTIAILFVVLFVVTVTAGAVSALNPQPEPPIKRPTMSVTTSAVSQNPTLKYIPTAMAASAFIGKDIRIK